MADTVFGNRSSKSTRSEATASLSKPANLLKLVVILVSFAGFVAVYHWVNKAHASGFVFTRLGFLEANVQGDGPLLERYASFPFAAAFLAMVRTTLRTTSINAAFFPVIPGIAMLFIYPFARLFFENRLLAVVASVPTYFSVFALSPHFAEYTLGRLFFLLFVFATVLFLNDEPRHRRRFGVLAFGFYMGVKFFAPPMEMWAISWMGFLLLLMTIRYLSSKRSPLVGWSGVGQVEISRSVLKRATLFTLLLLLVLFAYNPKLYDQFLVGFPIRGENIVASAEALALKIVGGGGTTAEFTALSESPRLLQLANIAKFAIIGCTIMGAIAYRIVDTGSAWVYRNFREVLALTLLGAYSVEMFVYAAVGAGIQVRYVILVFPILAIFYAANTRPRSVLAVVVAGLLLTSTFGVAYEVTEQPSREFVGTEPTEEFVEWEHEYSTSDRITTDHHTLGVLMAVSGERYQNPQAYDIVQLDTGMYANFDNTSNRDRYAFDYLVLNRETADEPAMKGPPSWTMYEPLGRYTEAMDSERNLRKVYESDSYTVYQSS